MSSPLTKCFLLISIYINMLCLSSISTNQINESIQISHGKNFIEYKRKSELDNDITGTGNKLRDIAYLASCISLNCDYKCCQGGLSNMTCGSEQLCKSLRELNVIRHIEIIIGVILAYLLIPIFWVIVKVLEKNNQKSAFNFFSKILVVYMGVLIPPYGIVIFIEKIYCPGKNDNSNDKFENKNLNFSVSAELFHCKLFQVEDFQLGVAKYQQNYDTNPSKDNNDTIINDVFLEYGVQ